MLIIKLHLLDVLLLHMFDAGMGMQLYEHHMVVSNTLSGSECQWQWHDWKYHLYIKRV